MVVAGDSSAEAELVGIMCGDGDSSGVVAMVVVLSAVARIAIATDVLSRWRQTVGMKCRQKWSLAQGSGVRGIWQQQ